VCKTKAEEGSLNIHYDHAGAVVGIEMNGTRYSPAAIQALAARVGELEALVTNLRDTLSTVADCGGNCPNCRDLARLALEGKFGDDE
jgi:hypothetical protein